MGPPCSVKISRVPTYSSSSNTTVISNTGLSPSMACLSKHFFYNNRTYNNWAVSRSLAATKEISVDFFSSGYLDVSVPQVRLKHLWIQYLIPPKRWVPPFGHLRVIVCLPTRRSFSQATTSFIAFCCQGIHRLRLIT